MRTARARLNRLAAALLLIVSSNVAGGQTPPQAQSPSGELGSTMTADQLGLMQKQAAEIAETPIEVRAAGEPVPALKYRFSPSPRELKPGSASVHFGRALLMFKNLPLDLLRKVDVSPGDPAPSPADEQLLLSAAGPMFKELHQLALAEDLQWDHRIRDLRGTEVWRYLLPDVQEARSLARMLRRRIDDQLARGDFEGALASIADGYRLAEFLTSGETLIQQLVALTIRQTMGDAAQAAMAKPGCPNLYWALACVRDDVEQMQRAVELDTSSFDYVFQMLPEAETQAGDEKHWQARLQELIAYMRELDGSEDLSFWVTVAAMTASPSAKRQLVEAGWEKEQVESMSQSQALMVNARRELRKWADQFAKGGLLEYPLSARVNDRVKEDFDLWSAENRYTSLAAALGSVLFPNIDSVSVVWVRGKYLHNRLMAVEALRMHLANHQGQLPGALEQLDPVPAPPNPFNNQPFTYTAKPIAGGVQVELSGEVPKRYEESKRLNVIFKDATLAPQ